MDFEKNHTHLLETYYKVMGPVDFLLIPWSMALSLTLYIDAKEVISQALTLSSCREGSLRLIDGGVKLRGLIESDIHCIIHDDNGEQGGHQEWQALAGRGRYPPPPFYSGTMPI